jgi:multiple sugar transport system ATP-binding protein
MSFATLAATHDGDRLNLRRADLSLMLPTAHLPGGGVPAEVIVGIRPEHTGLWTGEDGRVGPIDGRVEYVEMLGRETLIGLITGGDQRFTVLAAADSAVRPGEQARFGIEPGRLYLFDADTKQALGVV